MSWCIPVSGLSTLLRATVARDEHDYWSYVAGVACCVVTDFDVGGLHIDQYESDLPARKGLSSSAAVCVLVRFRALAFSI